MALVNYHSSILHEEDIRLCESDGAWLNDNVIGFQYDRFEHEIFAGQPNFLFVHPGAASFALYEEPEELEESLKSLLLPSRSVVFLPISDNDDPTHAAGGSHWTLLVVQRQQGGMRCLCCDTSPHGAAAGKVPRSTRLIGERFAALMSPGSSPQPMRFEQGKVPRQGDSSSCGVHVLALTETIATALTTSGADAELTSIPLASVTAHLVRQYRATLGRTLRSMQR